MSRTILATKLHAPPPRSTAVVRARLLERARAGLAARLLLVSAPPGFGKSTLVTQATAALPAGTASAWLSLDRADDEPAVFWSYVVAAIGSAVPEATAAVRPLVDGDEVPTDQVVTGLINGLAGLDRELVLALDDLHLIERPAIHEQLAFLLDRLPRQVHLVILTRADPPLPLGRMRAGGDLVEIRAADLRFTPDEAAAYLNDALGLDLDRAAVETLDSRTEGWIAALQLAAISVRDRQDRAGFIASFAGDDRYVVDYLADEVLEQQTPGVRDFLLATAVLDRLTGSLCDAVTGGTGGAAMLESLDRANLLLVPLDDRRRWYRYHHLFADLLRDRLREQRPGDVALLHRRASDWWWAHDDPTAAIDHALAAGDGELAADRIEPTANLMRRTRQEVTLRRWLDALPDATFDRRPVLAIAHAGALLSTGESAGVERRLAAAERWLPAAGGEEAREAAEAQGMVVHHPTALAHLPGAIGVYRAALAQMRGDLAASIAQARAVHAATPADQPLERGAAAGLLALAEWSNGELDAAVASWRAAIADLERADHRADMLGGHLAIGDIRLVQGRLDDAQRSFAAGIALGRETSPPLRGTADMHVGLAEVALARGDLDAARRSLEASEVLGEGLGLPQHPCRLRLAQAGLAAASGDPEAALALLDDAERRYVPDMFPDVRPVASVRARLLARMGRPGDALAWAERRGLSTDDVPSYLREHEHITLAETLVGAGREADDRARLDAARAFIDRLCAAAAAGGRGRSVAELRALDALATADAGAAAPPGRRTAPGLVEPLSERELEVLRLLAGDLDGPQIAAHLYISLNTLRTHTRNIFAKLEVGSRRAAVTRATELGLLARSR